LLVSPGLVGMLLGGFVLSYFLQLIADRRMNRVFSQFWHQVQPGLRSALKGARTSAAHIQERVKQFG
jgi:predicted metal-dependent RNase